jgi:hypothetical protein
MNMSVQRKIVTNNAFPEIENDLVDRLLSEPVRVNEQSGTVSHSKKVTGFMRVKGNVANWLTIGFGAQAA